MSLLAFESRLRSLLASNKRRLSELHREKFPADWAVRGPVLLTKEDPLHDLILAAAQELVKEK